MDITPNETSRVEPLVDKSMNDILDNALPNTPITSSKGIDMGSLLDNPSYTPTTLRKEDVIAMSAIKENLISTLNNSLKNIEILKTAIQNYNGSLTESLNANLEFADIINKYTEPDRNSSTYGLPGVFSTTLASYDIDALKKDNSRLAVVKSEKEDANRRRDNFFKTIVSSFSSLRSELNTFGEYNQRLFTFLEELNNKI